MTKIDVLRTTCIHKYIQTYENKATTKKNKNTRILFWMINVLPDAGHIPQRCCCCHLRWYRHLDCIKGEKHGNFVVLLFVKNECHNYFMTSKLASCTMYRRNGRRKNNKTLNAFVQVHFFLYLYWMSAVCTVVQHTIRTHKYQSGVCLSSDVYFLRIKENLSTYCKSSLTLGYFLFSSWLIYIIYT